jgi:hypothetical protein
MHSAKEAPLLFYRKSEMSEVIKRRLSRASREEGFEGMKMKDAKAATCPSLIGSLS